MKTLFDENKTIVATYPFTIPATYPAKAPKTISKKFHEGCEIIRRGRITEGLDVLMSEGDKYHPLIAYVLGQLCAYFEKDWNRVMDLLVYAISNEAYYQLIIAYWRDEKLFDYLLVNMAAIKTGRTDEGARLLQVLGNNIDSDFIPHTRAQLTTDFKKDKLLQPHEYLSIRQAPESGKLDKMFEEVKTKDYYRQDYCHMAYGFIKSGEPDKAAEAITGWNEYRTNYIDAKSVTVIPMESLVLHEFYGIGDDAFMAAQWTIQQKARYVRLPEDGPADTRLPKSKPCNNLKGFKVSGLLEAAFGDKQCVCDGWIFEKLALGNIDITSGKIVADDPLIVSSKEFTAQFPKGSFPVEIAVARKFGDQRVALARIKFSGNEIQNWDIALTDTIKPKKGELYGYAVDTGTGCFADTESYTAYEKQLDGQISDFIVDEFDKNGNTGLIYKNVAMFSTGLGDGFYQSYIGRDAGGDIVCLVTDFQLINK